MRSAPWSRVMRNGRRAPTPTAVFAMPRSGERERSPPNCRKPLTEPRAPSATSSKPDSKRRALQFRISGPMNRFLGAVSVCLLALSLHAGTYVVNSTADSGGGTLRDAIIQADNGVCSIPCSIVFNIPGPVPDSGYFTIKPLSPLPPITWYATSIFGGTQTLFTGDTNPFGPEVEIDGSQAGNTSGFKFFFSESCTIDGLAINGFAVN